MALVQTVYVYNYGPLLFAEAFSAFLPPPVPPFGFNPDDDNGPQVGETLLDYKNTCFERQTRVFQLQIRHYYKIHRVNVH